MFNGEVPYSSEPDLVGRFILLCMLGELQACRQRKVTSLQHVSWNLLG